MDLGKVTRNNSYLEEMTLDVHWKICKQNTIQGVKKKEK